MYGVVVGAMYGDVTIGGRAVVSLPHRVGVPPALADQRVDRPADENLVAALTGVGDGVVVLSQVLAGLGGVGKTQVAANLAHRWWRQRQVDLLVWVAATSRTEVVTRFARAAADLTGIEDSDPTDSAERFLAWLASTDRRWLVVLDDVTDPDDLTGLWPPASSTGRTILTTRRRDHALTAGRHVIDVDVFTPDQAHTYLHDKLRAQPRRLVEAAELAADLGHLPLALAQAAAYIDDQIGTTCADYRQQLHRSGLAAVIPAALPYEHCNPVTVTWKLSVDLADRYTDGLAGPVLELAALLDPNAMPVELFTTPAVLYACEARVGRPVADGAVLDTLRVLHRLSLATLNDTATVLRVHGVIQRAVRETTGPEHQRSLATAAADALVSLWPTVESDLAHAQVLRANAATLHATTGTALWTIPTATTPWRRIITQLARRPRYQAHPLLFRAGNSLGEAGLVVAAITYYEHLRTTAIQHLGPDHPGTLTTGNNLALWRGQAGDPAGAATAFEQLLADVLRVLGPNHPGTLTTRHNLALWRGEAGDPAGAATALEQLLADRLRVLGPDHPDTLTTRGNLARYRGEAGDSAGAATAFEQSLADCLRVLGPDHPDTLTTRHNLAL
ncbi:tetratricopeptide repeat protein [Dactylosporangium sp. CA-139066]|uniref:tetratricopeptide repeat protein n=1 Tax=Dactylosporangium sp. CA-139066 TaxID=3239930 RepID=UPI003D93402F